MNSKLIPTVSSCLDGETQPLVNAKDLHAFLGVETKFRDWIKRRILDYKFSQDIDFCVISNLSNRGFWKTESKDYLLSIDMAKELCMVERNEKGRQARRYFIEMERVAKHGVNREYVAVLESQNQALKTELARLAPKFVRIAFYHNVGLDMAEMRLLTARSTRTVRRNLQRLTACGLTDYQPDPYMSALGRLGNLRRRQNAEFLAAQQSLGLEG